MSYLALDLGAGSGRAIVGTIKDGRVYLDEVHRFSNSPVKLGNTLYWNFLSLFQNIRQGIHLAVKKGYNVRGIAVDTWGVDFGLTDQTGKLISNPVCYRDTRTQGMIEKAMERVSKEELYAVTGIQQMEINSLFQMLSMESQKDPAFSMAYKLLFIPDLINYYLTGNVWNEYTIASTSQLLNAETKMWEKDILDKLKLPPHLLSEIIKPCSVAGKLKDEIAKETGANKATVFAVASHDTASAIAAIPFSGEEWGFLSSGTWSLLGIQTEKPILTHEAMENDFTNEGGANDKILFMRNITGLWLLQKLIAEWKMNGEECPYHFLLSECEKCKPFGSLVDSDSPDFMNPGSMTEAIQDYCKRTGQYIPDTKGELVRCVLESLAMKYHFVMKKLEKTSNRKIKHLAVVGGGSRNELLNQYIANALNAEVVTGLTEATAIGNVIQQAVADNRIADLEEGHLIIKNSFDFKIYYPGKAAEWDAFAVKMKYLFE